MIVSGKNSTYRHSVPSFTDWEKTAGEYGGAAGGSSGGEDSSDSEYENEALQSKQDQGKNKCNTWGPSRKES